jgi:hypothetical protein
MQSVEIYIYVDGVGNRIELFNDEKISVTSSVQNFSDLGKLFTDYSQSFTIPASKHNNAIFKHWYESAVGESDLDSPQDVIGAFDHRIKYYGFIEIDTIPFRDGKFTMEKANKKNGFIESYTINFVGNLVQLKDKFKADKLNSLKDENGLSYYNELNFEYTVYKIVQRLNPSFTSDVRFPLVGNTRRFEYLTGNVDNDITLLTGGIEYTELFPAIKISKILDYIQSAYGLEFTGDFLNSQTFTKLYLYCKNSDEMSTKTELAQSTLEYGATGLPVPNNTLTINYVPFYHFIGPPTLLQPVWSQRVYLFITTASTNYNVYVYNNGTLYTSFLNQSGNISYRQFFYRQGPFTDTYNFTVFVNSDELTSFTFQTDLQVQFTEQTNGYTNSYSLFTTTPTTSLALLNIQKFIPDITVVDFLTGLVKMFNMVIIPINENTFEFMPLELWYQNGTEIDLTKFVEAENIEIGKPKLFKKIEFKHEDSENILNNNFKNFNDNQEYGNLFYDNENSAFTENYEVKTPFEDIMWERTTGTDFLTATCWNKDRQPYTPKPVLMYYNDGESFEGGSTNWIYVKDTPSALDFHLFAYPRFSNEIQLGSTDLTYLQTLNWGVENSVWNLDIAPNGLYQQFYSNYINNLYNQRTRVVKAKSHFNPYLLSSINLNDRIILSNKRYLINTLTTDLTTGEVELELINDFRDITENTTYLRYANIMVLNVDNTEQVVEFLVYRNSYDTFDTVASGGFLSYPLRADNDTDIILNVTIPANTSGIDRSDSIALKYYKDGVLTDIKIPVIQYA